MQRSGKLPNHDHTSTETLGSKVGNTNLASNLADRLALVLSLAELRDKRVSGVGDDGADDTGDVTGGEGDTELHGLAVGVLGCGEDVLVEEADNVLEEEELGHRIGDLME